MRNNHLKPKQPVIAVAYLDDERLEAPRAIWLNRWVFFPLFFIGPWYMAYTAVFGEYGLMHSWDSFQKQRLSIHAGAIRNYGEDYLNNTYDFLYLLNHYKMGDDLQISFRELLTWFYLDSYPKWGFTYILPDLIFPAFFFLLGLFFFIWFLLWKQRPHMVFDRKHQAVYTWYNNRIFAQRWEYLEFLEDRFRGTSLFLCGENAATKNDWWFFPFNPSTHGIRKLAQEYSDKSVNPTVEVLDLYMREGLAGVPWWKERKNRFTFPALRHHRKPKNFDYRLQRLLEDIDILGKSHNDYPKK